MREELRSHASDKNQESGRHRGSISYNATVIDQNTRFFDSLEDTHLEIDLQALLADLALELGDLTLLGLPPARPGF